MTEKTDTVKRLCLGACRVVDLARRVFVNLLFVAVVVAALVLLFRSDEPDIADTTALVVAPEGRLVEQLTGPSFERLLDKARVAATPETLLKDVLDAIEAGREDERVQVLVLELSNFDGAGLTKLQDVGAAIVDFKSSGKKVVAAADSYGQDAYYLAAHADEVLMHHMGLLLLEGFGRFRMYHKDGIDRLGVDVHVFRVGEYKTAVEPYLRDSMSDEAKEANLEWLGDLWRQYLKDVSSARGIKVDQLKAFITNFADLVERADGEGSKAALDAGLIDAATTRDDVRDRLIELVGENEDTHSYNRVGFQAYLETLDEDRFGRDAEGDRVGVVVARGTITDGSHPPGTIGGDSTSTLIRQARNNEDIKAIVLRVDSGGGSAFASELIRRELELARADGKPVVVSMGSVAASGGYWISMASDQVWAYPGTITGSIGIFGMFPTFQKPLANYLGTRVDGVGTTPLAGALRLDRELAEEVGPVIQRMTDQGYEDFITIVAKARGLSTEEVDRIARGRVWSGEDALELELVDAMGGLDGAIAAAAKLAELGTDYEVSYIEKELSFEERITSRFLTWVAGLAGSDASAPSSLTGELVRRMEREAVAFLQLNAPNGLYADSRIEVD